MQQDVFKKLFEREPASHKYNYGHVLVVGGSAGMVGAPFLAAKAALRVGAGLVTIVSSHDVVSKLEERVVELMTLSLPTSAPAQALTDFITDRKVSVVIIGPGMKPDFALSLLEPLLKQKIKLVIDGGALAALAENQELIKNNKPDEIVLTPHQGEFNRFFIKPPETSDQSLKLAADFAKENKLVLVLKGHPTYVYDAKANSTQIKSGGPALATAGTGDVLSGLIGGIIAQGIEAYEAAAAACFLHGKLGQIVAETNTDAGVIASDLINAIPNAFKMIANQIK
jgi:hydroxyethylthiazole kinase-like uncharacterized protein yjeF